MDIVIENSMTVEDGLGTSVKSMTPDDTSKTITKDSSVGVDVDDFEFEEKLAPARTRRNLDIPVDEQKSNTSTKKNCSESLRYGQIPYYLFWIYVVPFLVSFALPKESMVTLFWVGISIVLLNNLLIIAETATSFWVWHHARSSHRKHEEESKTIPSDYEYFELAAIIAAYLPNEINGLDGTLRSMSEIEVPKGARLRIIVAHNGGTEEQGEQLQQIINEIPKKHGLELIQVGFRDSTSKADNVNGCINFFVESGVLPSICAIFDADHHPDPKCYKRAIYTMEQTNADILQGRCVASRITGGFISNLVHIEFDVIYGVYHPGGMVIRQFGIFGGTNGYWKFETLHKTGMDTTMLTEDIDSTFRALRSGAKIVYDPLVISHEEPPPTLRALIKQRFRWCQGWSQVAVRNIDMYCFDFHNTKLSLYQKFTAFLFLHWREIGNYFGAITLPAAIANTIRTEGNQASHAVVILLGILTIVPILAATVAEFLVRGTPMREFNLSRYLVYCLVGPFYEHFKVAIMIIGHYRNICGRTRWKVTTRKLNKQVADDDGMIVPRKPKQTQIASV